METCRQQIKKQLKADTSTENSAILWTENLHNGSYLWTTYNKDRKTGQ